MRIFYGTTNPAKLQSMRDMLCGLNIQILGLDGTIAENIEVEESGNTPLENARIKALAYYDALQEPVFSCDSGLYLEETEDSMQPGVNIRRVKGKTLNDEEMIEHYTKLVTYCGGEAKARYKNAICLILDYDNVFEYYGEDLSSASFIITSKCHPKINPGFPLDSMSLEMKSGKYYNDICHDNKYSNTQGFRDFFSRTILGI